MLEIGTFFLHQDDPFRRAVLGDEVLPLDQWQDDDPHNSKWIEQHEAIAHKCGLQMPSQLEMVAFSRTIPHPFDQSWFSRQKRRVQVACYLASAIAERELLEFSIDPEQSISRWPLHWLAILKMPCFTSNAVPWLALAKRVTTGLEMLAFIGITKKDLGIKGAVDMNGKQVTYSDDRVFRSLAGNAFSGPCCMTALISALAGIHQTDTCTGEAASYNAD